MTHPKSYSVNVGNGKVQLHCTYVSRDAGWWSFKFVELLIGYNDLLNLRAEPDECVRIWIVICHHLKSRLSCQFSLSLFNMDRTYFLMMVVLTFYVTYQERGIFMVALEKDLAGVDPDNTWNLASRMNR